MEGREGRKGREGEKEGDRGVLQKELGEQPTNHVDKA